MNISPVIETALTSLNKPTYPNVCEGTKPDEYITYNYSDERPALRGDDTDLADETTAQIHYFTKLKANIYSTVKAIRAAIRAAGFTIINTQQFYETETGYTHVVVEAWIEGIIED